MDRSIIFLCGLKYWTGHHSRRIRRQCRIVLPSVAKFGSMECKDTIEIRVFSMPKPQWNLLYGFFFITKGGVYLIFKTTKFTLVIEMTKSYGLINNKISSVTQDSYLIYRWQNKYQIFCFPGFLPPPPLILSLFNPYGFQGKMLKYQKMAHIN